MSSTLATLSVPHLVPSDADLSSSALTAAITTPPRSTHAPSTSAVSPGVLELSSTVLRTPVRGSATAIGRSDQLLAELSPFGRAVIEATVAQAAHTQIRSAPTTPQRRAMK